jgi:predicted permease
MENLLQDTRYALRFLRRSPGFTFVAVLSLAVGIGVNAALFTVVDALLLRPLPVAQPEALVDIFTSGSGGEAYQTSSYLDYLDFKAESAVFEDVAGHTLMLAALNLEDRSRLVMGEVVTGNYFRVLGLEAARGRTLLPEDDRSGAERVAMVSYRYWQRELGGTPSVVGHTLRLRGQSYTIVGVAPRNFGGLLPMIAAEVWLPTAQVDEVEPAGIQDVVPSPTGNTRLERRGSRWLFLKGRLRPGATLEQAQARLGTLMGRLELDHPQTNKGRKVSLVATRRLRVHPLADEVLRPVAAAAMGFVGLVLLIACANVAALLLARASGRRREIGIRMAIGASRGQVVRQLLVESVVLSLLGGLAGAALAWGGTRLLTALPLPIPIPLSFDLRLDARVLAFTFAAALVAGLVAGLAPALRASRPDLVSDLRGETPAAEAGGRRLTLRDGLVAAQMAVTFVLLVAAGLVGRSVLASKGAKLGFDPGGLAIVSTDPGMLRYSEERSREFYERAEERIRALPGVVSVATAFRLPFSLNFNESQFDVPGHVSPEDRGFTLKNTAVSAEYFQALGVPVLQGRGFLPSDTPESPRVAVVNEALARRFWPGESAVGRVVHVKDRQGAPVEIVGVVADYRVQTVGEGQVPYMHFASSQRFQSYQLLFARTKGDPQQLLAQMRRILLDLEPNLVFLDNQTMQAQVTTMLLPVLAGMTLASVAGLIALSLATLGLYGVVAYSVARRTREIGVRMALGADRARVVRLVLRQGLGLALFAVGAGSLLAAVLSRSLAGVLFGVQATDAAAWGVAVALVLGTALAANALPALRASRVSPQVALRAD